MKRILIVSCVISAIIFVLYGRTLSYDFAYDDYAVVVVGNNDHLAPEEYDLQYFIQSFLTPTHPGDLYRPVTTLSYRLNAKLCLYNAECFHLFNILIYVVASVLAYFFAARLFSQRVAIIATAIFVLTPLHVEAAANIVGRAEMLSWLFGVAGCLLAAKKRQSIFNILLVCLCALLAALSKESGLVFMPLILLTIWHVVCKEKNYLHHRQLFVLILGFLVVGATAVLSRMNILGEYFLLSPDSVRIVDGMTVKYFSETPEVDYYPENPLMMLSFVDRLVPALKVLGDYIGQFILPIHLSADYSASKYYFWKDIFSYYAIPSYGLLLVLLFTAILRRGASIGFGALWFFISFALTSNVVTVIGTIRGDRLMFTPSFGLAVIVAIILTYEYKDKICRFLARFGLSCLLCFYGYRTYFRIPVWQDTGTVFKQTAIDSPCSPKALQNLGMYYFQDYKDLKLSRQYLFKALKYNPNCFYCYKYLSAIAFLHNQNDIAERWLSKAIRLIPTDPELIQQYKNLHAYKAAHPNPDQKQSP